MIEITPEYLAAQHLSEDFPQRFWSKVNKTDSCWLWAGCKVEGYGSIARGAPFKKAIRSSIASWILHKGPVPEGLCVLHNCPGGDNPACVNFEHLWIGTKKENTQDCINKGRFPFMGCGEQHARSKLTAAAVIEIRAIRAAGGATCETLAQKFGVSANAITEVTSRRCWNHI